MRLLRQHKVNKFEQLKSLAQLFLRKWYLQVSYKYGSYDLSNHLKPKYVPTPLKIIIIFKLSKPFNK